MMKDMEALFILRGLRKGRLGRFPERWEALLPLSLPALPVDVPHNMQTRLSVKPFRHVSLCPFDLCSWEAAGLIAVLRLLGSVT